jgi:hypothetical protein
MPDRIMLTGEYMNYNDNFYEIENDIMIIKGRLTATKKNEIKKKINHPDDTEKLKRFFYIHDNYIEAHLWDMREGSCDNDIYDRIIKFVDVKSSDSAFISKETGELQHGGWGIKEMLISANFLRKNPSEILISGFDDKEPPIMTLICNSETPRLRCRSGIVMCNNMEKYKNRLGICFYLRRPKDMCVLQPDGDTTIEVNNFEVDLLDDYQKGSEIPHRLLLLPNRSRKDFEGNPLAPIRLVTYKEKINNINDSLYLHKYERFIKKTLNNNQNLPKIFYGNERKQLLNVNSDHCIAYNVSIDKVDAKSVYFINHPEKSENLTNDDLKKISKSNSYFQTVSGASPFRGKIDSLSSL